MHLQHLPFLPSGSATDVAVFTADDIFLRKASAVMQGFFVYPPPPLKGSGGFRVFLLSFPIQNITSLTCCQSNTVRTTAGFYYTPFLLSYQQEHYN